jgi:hypothetical protein
MLLGLPLPAVQLLLSSDQLCVPSEDTVLYTAKQYIKAQQKTPAKRAAKAALAQLVRAPELSVFALSCEAPPADSDQQLLTAYIAWLGGLLSLKRNASATELAEFLKDFTDCPASWRFGSHQLMPLADGVQLEWRLPVEDLKQACRESLEKEDKVWLYSRNSPPFGGVAWQMKVLCDMQEHDGAVSISLNVGPARRELPAGIYYKVTCTLSWQDAQRSWNSPCLSARRGQIFGSRFVDLQPMDGWDEAWEVSGLPEAGEVLLKMHVHSVE